MNLFSLRFSLLCGVALTVCAYPAASQADWSQYQGNAAHTGYVAGALYRGPLSRKWEREFTNGQNNPAFLTELAVSQQGIFVVAQEGPSGDNKQFALLSLDRATGEQRWRNDYLYDGPYVAAPSVSGDIVYIRKFGQSGLNDPRLEQKFIGVNASDGQTRFAIADKAPFFSGSRPTVANGQAFILRDSNQGVSSFDAATGRSQWVSTERVALGSTPAADERRVYMYQAASNFGSGDGALYALDRATGVQEYAIPNPNDISSTSIGLATVMLGWQADAFATSQGDNGFSQITGFDLEGGTVRWNREDMDVRAPLAVAPGMVVAPLFKSVKALDERTGDDIWTWTAPDQGFVTSNALLTDSLAFITARKEFSGDTLFGIDRFTGRTLWSEPLGIGNAGFYDLAYFNGSLYLSGGSV